MLRHTGQACAFRVAGINARRGAANDGVSVFGKQLSTRALSDVTRTNIILNSSIHSRNVLAMTHLGSKFAITDHDETK